MNSGQLKRLFVVVLLPLLLFGWWIAEKELLAGHHFIVDCDERFGKFECYSFQRTQAQLNAIEFDRGGIFYSVYGGAIRLGNALNEKVVTLPHYDFGGREIEGGVQKQLKVGRHAGVGYCYLRHLMNIADNDWEVFCPVNPTKERFRFVDEKVNAKYSSAILEAYAEMGKLVNISRLAYWFSVLIPVVAFLCCLALLKIFIKLVGYVRHGSNNA